MAVKNYRVVKCKQVLCAHVSLNSYILSLTNILNWTTEKPILFIMWYFMLAISSRQAYVNTV